ncbi:MAG: phosphatidylglycerol lysyltransferase domain-containing protein [Candidatus Thorarchaeota archaeon]
MLRPLGKGALDKLPDVIAVLNSNSTEHIQIVCLNNEDLKVLKKNKRLEIKSIKEFNYFIYDLDTMNDLRGVKWKNVRQKISTFRKNHPKLKIEHLSKNNYEDVIHFIGAWRRTLLSKRGLSYSNLEKNKFAAKYYSDKNDFKNIWSTVYRLSKRVVAFQLLYRLGPNSAAHAIGLADTSIPGLSETTQINIWEQLQDQRIRYINDGPSWRVGLDRYKRKFNPISAQKVFECKLKSK